MAVFVNATNPKLLAKPPADIAIDEFRIQYGYSFDYCIVAKLHKVKAGWVTESGEPERDPAAKNKLGVDAHGIDDKVGDRAAACRRSSSGPDRSRRLAAGGASDGRLGGSRGFSGGSGTMIGDEVRCMLKQLVKGGLDIVHYPSGDGGELIVLVRASLNKLAWLADKIDFPMKVLTDMKRKKTSQVVA